jgi:hypothetical protein
MKIRSVPPERPDECIAVLSGTLHHFSVFNYLWPATHHQVDLTTATTGITNSVCAHQVSGTPAQVNQVYLTGLPDSEWLA